MTERPRAARRLLAGEEVFGDPEARATETHFARIRAGRVESVETRVPRLDVLRDLKHINGHLTAADTASTATVSFYRAALRQDAAVGEES